MPQLVVQLSPSVAADLAAGQPKTSAARAVARAVKSARGSVSPMHPGAADPTLACYFSVDLPGEDSAATLAEKLNRLPSVEAAYVKPADALPGG